MHPILLGLLKKAPELIVIAKQLADGIKGSRTGKELGERVAALERNELKQADLVREMARQINDLSTLNRVLHGRLLAVTACAVVALLLALYALLRTFV
jgi:hypothetical protein